MAQRDIEARKISRNAQHTVHRQEPPRKELSWVKKVTQTSGKF